MYFLFINLFIFIGNKHLYQRREQLGEGAYAQVFSCERQDGLHFAVKVFSPVQADDDDDEIAYIEKCTHREIAFLKLLSHPYIVHCEEAVEHKNIHHIVLEKMTCSLLEVCVYIRL